MFISKSLRRTRQNRFSSTRYSALECLEPRTLLTAAGLIDISSLTISFAPDGTHVAGYESNLFSEMASQGTEAEWQDTIVSAFRTWMQEIDGDVVPVADGGQDFGVAGPAQGDLRFGDIRIASVPLSDGNIAVAIPHDATVTGTWAGDILFNSDVDLANLDEVFSITLHEAGHVLGLQHSADPESAMFSHTDTNVMQPTASDLSNLRRLYGTHSEASDDNNDKRKNAEQLTNQAPVGAFSQYEVTGSIQAVEDVDHFQFSSGDESGGAVRMATIVLNSTFTNGQIPELTLMKSSGKVLESTVMVTGDGRIILQSSEVEAGKDYIVRVNSNGVEAVGEYRLTISFSCKKSTFEKLASGTLAAEKAQKTSALYVAESQLFTFALSAQKLKKNQTAGVVMSVFDASGALVYYLATATGETRINNSVLLAPGAYTVITEAVLPPEAKKSTEVEYKLLADESSIPVGPMLRDPTMLPAFHTSEPDLYVYPGDVYSPIPFILLPLPTLPPTTFEPRTTSPPVSTNPVANPQVPVSWRSYLNLMGYPA